MPTPKNADWIWRAQKKSLPDDRKALSVIYCSLVLPLNNSLPVSKWIIRVIILEIIVEEKRHFFAGFLS